jgi:hypothetical protein
MEYYQQFPGALPAGGTTLTSATELAYFTSYPVEIPEANQGAVISGYVEVTLAATGTGFTIKCRRGTGVAGTQIGNTQTFSIAANASGQTVMIPYSFIDTSPQTPDSAASQGVYTISLTATTAGATAVDGSISVRVPDIGGAET